MKSLKLESLSIETMHSGRACLNLTSSINWEEFPDYAQAVLNLLDGNINKKTDAVDVRIWEVIIDKEKFYLTYDDFPAMVSIESLSKTGDLLLSEFKIKLSR
ncbi:DUF3630 family protein [Pseudomonas sp. NPDC089743]|uniref:DUF3630 family protein n=1 Tax=Pseudomonas sp. NPDC089743 TaxID=3364471 RepID=UPI003813E38F